MKLATFQLKKSPATYFGAVEGNQIIPFETDIQTYLRNLPKSERKAGEFIHAGQNKAFRLEEIHFLAPVPNPPAYLDFALSPRHLRASLKTLLQYEYPWWLRGFIRLLVNGGIKRRQKAGLLPYYKGNPHAFIGDGEEAHWPDYSAYLDLEPELAFIVGNEAVPVAGYTILNDWSARDVEMPEMFGTGPARSKDFERSKGLGPYLVTSNEIENPLNLKVKVKISDRAPWEGNTAEYSASPEEVFRYLAKIFRPKPGTVIGMGALPGLCGLDRDEWVRPGDRIEIDFEGIGTLHQRVPQKNVDPGLSPWKRQKSRKYGKI